MALALRKEEGFTLIELMVVVLIIGILVAVAIPVFASASNNARNKACLSNMRTIDGAVNTFIADTEAAPAALANLIPDYLKSTPQCPVNPAHAYALIVDPNNANSKISNVNCDATGYADGHP